MNKTIPLLEPADIECRVQQLVESRNGDAVILLLYKDARTDMRMLDEVYGVGNWQRTHEVINGNLFCNIDIWDEDKKCWVRKQDVGVESNTEKEKGQASDSFKRAGFNVGIGRELYTAPFIYIPVSPDEVSVNQKSGKKALKTSVKFEVTHIAYNDRREIVELTIADNKGVERFRKGGKSAPKQKEAPKKEEPADPLDSLVSCDLCGKIISAYPGTDGKPVSPQKHANASKKKYNCVLCLECIKRM